MSDFSYEIIENLGTLSDKNGWSKELKIVKYGNGVPKMDIRTWSEDEDGNKKMSKGITLTKQEAISLRDLLDSIDVESLEF